MLLWRLPSRVHQCYWAVKVISFCSVTTMTATILACLLGQPRIFFGMSEDGLLFRAFSKLNKDRTPVIGTLVGGSIAALLALIFDVDTLSSTISLGTLLAFSVVCGGLILVRFRRSTPSQKPSKIGTVALALGSILTFALLRVGVTWYAVLPVGIVVILGPGAYLLFIYYKFREDIRVQTTGFQCPLFPVLPCGGVVANIYLMLQLPGMSYAYFAIWSVLGFAIYFLYGIRHSKLANAPSKAIDDCPDCTAAPQADLPMSNLGKNSDEEHLVIHSNVVAADVLEE